MPMTPVEFDAVTDCDHCSCHELIKRVSVVTRLPTPAESDPNEDFGVLLIGRRLVFIAQRGAQHFPPLIRGGQGRFTGPVHSLS
jgi:hypothetical protein